MSIKKVNVSKFVPYTIMKGEKKWRIMMRNRRNITQNEYKQIQKLKKITARINRNQVIKMGISIGIILPVLLLITSGLNFMPIEMTLGYFLLQLIALNYYHIQDWRLSTIRHNLMVDLNARAAKARSSEFVSTIRNGVRLSNYSGKLAAVG